MDLRFALRLLWKDRGFTATTVATLALCLAANVAIFAVVNSVLLKPLPFPGAERLVAINNSYPEAGVERTGSGVPDYYDRLALTDVLEEIALYRSTGITLGGEGQGEAERVTSMPVTPSFFRLLHAQPFRGRLLTEQEAEPGQERKAVLSYALWQRRFGGRDDALGQDVRINGVPHVIVGILPRDFSFLDPDVQLWTAVAFTAEQRGDDQRHSNNWQQVARLKPQATIEQAQAQIDALNARNLDRFPSMREVLVNAGFTTIVSSFQDDLVAEARPTLMLLWGGVAVVLLIGCVNVANLVSIRATGRVKELATRAALGASVGRLSRQMIAESLLLSAAGGAAGLALGWWALKAAPLLGLDRLPRGHEIALDAGGVLFTLGLIVAVGLVVALMPVVALRRANLGQIIREEGRSGTATFGARLARRVMVTSQVAFALVLLFGAGLLLASFDRVLAINPGFNPERLLTANVSLPASRYAEDRDIEGAAARFLDGVRAIPGVQAAGLTSSLPLSGNYSDSVILAEGHQMKPGESLVSPSMVRVSPGYLEAMETPLLRGRFFDGRDGAGAPRSIIVDEQLAARFWGEADPIGRRLYFPESNDDIFAPPKDDQWLTVVGVVGAVRLRAMVDGGRHGRVGAYYLPISQSLARTVTLAVRTAGDPMAVVPDVRRALAGIDPELPLYGVRAMEERVDAALIDRRTPTILAAGFAVVALLLSAIGIYGMLAYQVSQRRREIGIRMALGAETRSIFGMVLREGAAIVGVGSAIGAVGAYLAQRAIASQLYEVGALDARVLVGVAGVLLAVAAVACLLPARRAAGTNPVIALSE